MDNQCFVYVCGIVQFIFLDYMYIYCIKVHLNQMNWFYVLPRDHTLCAKIVKNDKWFVFVYNKIECILCNVFNCAQHLIQNMILKHFP